MRRGCRFNQEFLDKAVDIIEGNWVPFVNQSSNGAGFRIGLVTSITVRVKAIGQSPCVEDIAVRVFRKVKEEDKFLQQVLDVESDKFFRTIGSGCFEADLVFSCKSFKETCDNINSRLFISMGVVNEHRQFII